MIAHMRRMSLLGAPVNVLAPEDVVLHKVLMGRGADQGKHDLADVAGIIRRQKIDLTYLRQRMSAMNLNGTTLEKLAQLGLAVSDDAQQ